MQKLLKILTIVSFGCNAQMIQPMYHSKKDVMGVYYKDTFNDLNKFVGTWKYTNGSTSLTIVLQKKLKQTVSFPNGSYYETDFLIGGYKYVENGIEKINTLSQLLQS